MRHTPVLPPWVEFLEQIAERPSPPMGQPPPTPMLLTIMKEVTALTKGKEVLRPIVRGVMI